MQQLPEPLVPWPLYRRFVTDATTTARADPPADNSAASTAADPSAVSAASAANTAKSSHLLRTSHGIGIGSHGMGSLLRQLPAPHAALAEAVGTMLAQLLLRRCERSASAAPPPHGPPWSPSRVGPLHDAPCELEPEQDLEQDLEQALEPLQSPFHASWHDASMRAVRALLADLAPGVLRPPPDARPLSRPPIDPELDTVTAALACTRALVSYYSQRLRFRSSLPHVRSPTAETPTRQGGGAVDPAHEVSRLLGKQGRGAVEHGVEHGVGGGAALQDRPDGDPAEAVLRRAEPRAATLSMRSVGSAILQMYSKEFAGGVLISM